MIQNIKADIMSLAERANAFIELGNLLGQFVRGEFHGNDLKLFSEISSAIHESKIHNQWFTESSQMMAIKAISENLSSQSIAEYIAAMKIDTPSSPKRIGVVMAGNIPLVGFHDFFSILISGNVFIGKLSSNDGFLLPLIANILIEIDSRFKDLIVFEPHLLRGIDAVIATGSNNSARYFIYYFGKYPSIIRKNRNSVAVIHEPDDADVLRRIGDDVFSYYGLGCRNVSKLLVPTQFDLNKILDAFMDFSFVRENNKYFNNYEYNKSIFLVNKVKHLDAGFLIFTEDSRYSSPISVLHYEFYENIVDVQNKLIIDSDRLQCVVSSKPLKLSTVKPGETQKPTLLEFADNVNVMSFLESLF